MTQTKWDSRNIPDQNDRIIIVTGSSSGLGFEDARILANKNAKVIVAVRNLEKGNNAVKKIKAQNNNADVIAMQLDLADLKSVAQFVKNFTEKFGRLDILINNAGVMIPPYSKTKDGFELQFGTNHLGHFALTAQLLPLLSSAKNPRIVNVSSNAHKMGNLDFDDLNWTNRQYKAWNAYGNSKIANLYFTYELKRRLNSAGKNIVVAAAHPGWTATELQRNSGLIESLNGLFAQKPQMGALPTLYAATANNVKSGDYFGPSGWQEWRGYPKKVESNKLSHDQKIAEKLWLVSEKLTNVKFNI